MTKPNVYAGETDAKRLARLAVYKRLEELQPSALRQSYISSALVLAGPEAGELGCLRHFLRMDAKAVWFVDKDKEGLEVAQKAWSGVRTFHGDALNAARSISIDASFINLDFCGHLTEEREKIVKRMAPMVIPWGMVFYTFFRGRENLDRRSKLLQTKGETMDGKRFLETAQVLQAALGPLFLPVFSLRYTGVQNLGPGKVRLGSMGILGFQKVPKGFQRNSHWQHMMASPSPYGGYVPTDKRLLQEHLRVEALNLRSRGLTSKEVASILNLNPGSVAAWFAIQSRQ